MIYVHVFNFPLFNSFTEYLQFVVLVIFNLFYYYCLFWRKVSFRQQCLPASASVVSAAYWARTSCCCGMRHVAQCMRHKSAEYEVCEAHVAYKTAKLLHGKYLYDSICKNMLWVHDYDYDDGIYRTLPSIPRPSHPLQWLIRYALIYVCCTHTYIIYIWMNSWWNCYCGTRWKIALRALF